MESDALAGKVREHFPWYCWACIKHVWQLLSLFLLFVAYSTAKHTCDSLVATHART